MTKQNLMFEIFNKLNSHEQDVIILLASKLQKGSEKYGQWSPKNEKRNLKKEALEECLDICNYLAFEAVKGNK